MKFIKAFHKFHDVELALKHEPISWWKSVELNKDPRFFSAINRNQPGERWHLVHYIFTAQKLKNISK